jgi:hypothetical protein
MDKSHRNRFFIRNLTNKSTINQLPDIIRCKKCNHYNNKQSPINANQLCTFCGNPISFL